MKWVEVSEARYEEMLGILLPADMTALGLAERRGALC